MFTLRNFLLRHHGEINRILLSYAKTDSPVLLGDKYEEWYKETNKNFSVQIDFYHDFKQKIDDLKQLHPYLDLQVNSWDLFNKDNEIVLEVDLE